MARQLTGTSHALLGLLSSRSWTTYELAKQVQRSLGWFWPRAERKLYDEPKHLAAEGLATATREATGRRPRTVYAITDEGRQALARWLGERPAPPTLEFEGMVKVFFADAGTKAQLEATLRAIEEDAEAARAELEAMVAERRAEGDAYEFAHRRHLNDLAMRFQLDHQAHIAEWARWARAEVAGWPDDQVGGRK